MITQKTFLHLVAQAGFSTVPCVMIPGDFTPSEGTPWQIVSIDTLGDNSRCTLVPSPYEVSDLASKYGSERFLVNVQAPVIAFPVYTSVHPHYSPPSGFESQPLGLLTREQRLAWVTGLLEDERLIGILVSKSQTHLEIGSRFDVIPIIEALSTALDTVTGEVAVRKGVCGYCLIYLKGEPGSEVRRDLLMAGSQRPGYFQSLDQENQPFTQAISEPSPDQIGTPLADPFDDARRYASLTNSVVSLSGFGPDGIQTYPDYYQPVTLSGYSVRTPGINSVSVDLDAFLSPYRISLVKK